MIFGQKIFISLKALDFLYNFEKQKLLIMPLSDRITTDPGIFNGKPIIRGMRFGVADVLGYLAAGMTFDEILADFPYLEKEDIIAALEYAQDKVNHSIITVKLDVTK